jgi:hypothetical protein
MTQALEMPDLRRMLAGPDGRWWPQMILRIGYGEPVPGSPRRPVTACLEPRPWRRRQSTAGAA